MASTNDVACPDCGCEDCEQLSAAPYQMRRANKLHDAGQQLRLRCNHCGRAFRAIVSQETSETRTDSWWGQQSRT